MIPQSRWNPRLGIISLGALTTVIHMVLKSVLARNDIVSSIFAAGEHVPVWMVSIAAIFAVTRIFVLVLLPALLAWRLILWIGSHAEARVSKAGQTI